MKLPIYCYNADDTDVTVTSRDVTRRVADKSKNIKLYKNAHAVFEYCWADQGGRRVPDSGGQVLRGPGCGGRGQHPASHLDQELPCRDQDHHPAAAVPQQGQLNAGV